MKIVIQCAATKNKGQFDSGFKSSDGQGVKFVAHPGIAPIDTGFVYATPDDESENGKTWRELLVEYNMNKLNPASLLPAYLLYKHPAYQNLVDKFGLENIFILSAGWGLISADFLIPDYDITFSHAKNVQPHCRRSKNDNHNDFCHMPDDGEKILFLGGKDYFHLFKRLTNQLKAEKIICFNSEATPRYLPGLPPLVTSLRNEPIGTTQQHKH